VIAAHHIRPIDLVRFKSDEVRYFVNVSAGGFSGLVGEKLTPEMKKTWGPLAYLRGAAAALSDLRAYRTTVSLDNTESLKFDLYDVLIANGRYVGGGTNIAPEASADDGMLDVILIREQSPAELAVLAARLAIGNHLSTEGVVFRRAKRITVNSEPRMPFNVDGELVGNEPAEFEVLPRALQFVVPKP
jgi:diacylglycerol kinase (ATP)